MTQSGRTARSGSEPTIKYTAWEDNGRAPPYFAASSRRIIPAPALRAQLAGRDMARQRRHTAVGGRVEFVGIDERQRLRRVPATSSGVSIAWLATSIALTITFLPRINSSRSIGTRRVVALERDNIKGRFLQLRESLFILSPLGAQRLFPVGIGLDAIAVADMHRCLTLQPFGGSF